MKKFPFFYTTVLLTLIACAPKTRVVLLPDDSGTVGVVNVQTPKAGITLSSPYATTEVSLLNAPSPVSDFDKADFESRYENVLKARPPVPLSFLFYFRHDSVELLEPTAPMIQNIVKAAAEDTYSAIMVIGHTDSTGDSDYNNRLSLKRAKRIQQDLIAAGIASDIIEVESFGENDPLIPSTDDRPVPQNRRVEVFLR